MKIQAILLAILSISASITAYGNQAAADPSRRPELIQAVTPQAEDADVGTVVTALLTISEEGSIEALKVRHSNTPRFAESVAQAVKHWRFTPAHRNGEAIRSLVLVPFRVVPADTQVAMR